MRPPRVAARVDVLRAALAQMRHGDALDGNLETARRCAEAAREAGADLVLLPEYWFAVFPGTPADNALAAPRAREAMAAASRDLGVAVAGNVIERMGGSLWNLGLVYEDGRPVLEQPKVHPMPREAAAGVAGGDGLEAGHVRGRPAGMLVCADVLYPEAARVLALQGAELLLNPVMSPWREDDDTRGARDAVFVARAYDSGAFVLKAGGWRRASEPPVVAGRSLAAAPWGVLAKARDDFADELLVVDLDFERLRRFRDHQSGFPPRRPEAYGGLV